MCLIFSWNVKISVFIIDVSTYLKWKYGIFIEMLQIWLIAFIFEYQFEHFYFGLSH